MWPFCCSPNSSELYCAYDLLNLCVASICFTMVMIGKWSLSSSNLSLFYGKILYWWKTLHLHASVPCQNSLRVNKYLTICPVKVRSNSQAFFTTSVAFFSVTVPTVLLWLVCIFLLSGFGILLMLMEPVPWQVKLVFHAYGVASALFSFVTLSEVSKATSCVSGFLHFGKAQALAASAIVILKLKELPTKAVWQYDSNPMCGTS